MRRCSVENYQGGILPSCSINGAIRDTNGSIGRKWGRIGENRKEIHFQDIAGIRS